MTQRYIIIHEGKAFMTEWYAYENNYAPGMIVIDTEHLQVTFDGFTWQDIEEDHL